MKKYLTGFIGSALFVAGYHYVHRHAEYVSARDKPVSTAFTTNVDKQSLKSSPIFAFRQSKSFTASGSTAF